MNISNTEYGNMITEFDDRTVVFREIFINAGCSTKYQLHPCRGAFWYIREGEVQLKFGGGEDPEKNYSIGLYNAGETVDIPPWAAHQAIAITDTYIYETLYLPTISIEEETSCNDSLLVTIGESPIEN